MESRTPRLALAKAVAEVLGIDPRHPGTARLALALETIPDPSPLVLARPRDAIVHNISDRRNAAATPEGINGAAGWDLGPSH